MQIVQIRGKVENAEQSSKQALQVAEEAKVLAEAAKADQASNASNTPNTDAIYKKMVALKKILLVAKLYPNQV